MKNLLLAFVSICCLLFVSHVMAQDPIIPPPNTLLGTAAPDSTALPLFILDGEELASNDPLDLVDPNNIASISVIKNPAAENLYGKKGRDGVVVIKTKDYEEATSARRFEELQGFLEEAADHSEDYLFILDGVPLSLERLGELKELKASEIMSVEEISKKSSSRIYHVEPRKHTIVVTTREE